MKKLYSLIKACMTSDMNIFKFKSKKKSKKSSVLLPIIIAIYLMLVFGLNAHIMFEELSPMHLEFVLLAVFTLAISIMTIIEGVYKSGSLIFNCKDDQLLLSLPIKRSTVLFIRIFKFYVFELVFNSIFILPIMVVYTWWGNITWTYYLTSLIVLLLLPIIPIVISCIIGFITSSLSSRFKYKNLIQIVLSMAFVVAIILFSYSGQESMLNYFVKHANDIFNAITKIYYPAGAYVKLVVDFNVWDLIVFIFVHIGIFVLGILLLSKVYFKINSRLKSVSTTKKVKNNKLVIKSSNKTISLIKKELNTFFTTPVLVINAGFSSVLFIVLSIIITIKFNGLVDSITSVKELNITKDFIMSNISILIFGLIALTSCMTTITSSLISLEGKNINILRGLPIEEKTILMSKVYACLCITTPALLVGDIILFITFKTKFIEALLLILLSVLAPLVSHFIGLIVNLKYPKLDAENSTEVVKQSASSLVSTMIGMGLLVVIAFLVYKSITVLSITLILLLAVVIYIILNIILYLYLSNKGVKEFKTLSV